MSYGSADATPLVDFQGKPEQTSIAVHIDPLNPFDEDYQNEAIFWENVSNAVKRGKKKGCNVLWMSVETRLRLERLKDRYEGATVPAKEKKDTLVELLTTVYDNFYTYVIENNEEKLLDSFVRQLSDFVEILLTEDNIGKTIAQQLSDEIEDNEVAADGDKEDIWKDTSFNNLLPVQHRKYAELLPVKEKGLASGSKYILHIAAKRNLCVIAAKYMEMYPETIYQLDEPESNDTRKRMAVEVALDEGLMKTNKVPTDAVCALIMRSMLNMRVRGLFMGGKTEKQKANRARYSFGELVERGTMKETVLAVLNSCVNPDFPFSAEGPLQKNKEEAWTKMQGMPLRYDFFFQILDGDDEGKAARIFKAGDKVGTENDYYKHASRSALEVIAYNADTENKNELDPINHMVVRQLVRQKWKDYGEWHMKVRFGLHLSFLICMSVALFLGADAAKPSNYTSSLDKFRLFCEIVTLLGTVIYIISEFEEFFKEPNQYIVDWYNVLDVIGLAAIVIVIICRFARVKQIEGYLDPVAFFVNFIRLYKFFPAFPEYGIYSKTFAKIIYTDIRKFAVVFVVALLAFAGGIYFSLKAAGQLKGDFMNFWLVFLQETRAIAEGKEFSDSYSCFHVVITILLLLNMFTIIVIFSNILIGQISSRYADAQRDATIQFDIDKAKMITKLDRTWFKRWNKRVKYYKEGVFVSDQEIKDLVKDWKMIHLSGTEETENAIQAMLERSILKRK